MVVVIFIHKPISSATVSVIAPLHRQRAASTIALTCGMRGQPYSRTNARLAAMESFCMKRKKRTAFRFTPKSIVPARHLPPPKLHQRII